MTAPATLQDLVRSLAVHGAAPAVLSMRGDAVEAVSYAELSHRALRLAHGLSARGLRPGEPAILFGPNSADWIAVRLALAALGAVAVALDDVLTDAEVATLVPDSGARLAFVAAAHVARLRALPGGAALNVFVLDGPDRPDHWSTLMSPAPGELPALAPDDPVMLVYTSGTTGTPKGFELSHANVLANVAALSALGLVGPGDRALLPLPLHHVYPLTVGLLTPLACGTAVVLPEAATGPQIVKALKAARVQVMVGVPRLYAALAAGLEARVAARGALALRLFRALLGLSIALRRRFGLRVGRLLFGGIHRQLAPDLWLMASGGARLEPAAIWTLEGLGWEVLSGYGLAETASILTCNRRGRARIGTEGQPLPGVVLRIAESGPDGEGEIQARGPSVFRGYRRNPEASAAAFTADGWLRTGDLGRLDADGFLRITGRLKEVIVLGGGKKVYPEEVEAAFAGHRDLKEVAVFERAGALLALVLPDFEAIAKGANLAIADVVRVALAERAQRLAPYQRPTGYAVVREPLPRTRLGKYPRFRLPEIYERAAAGAAGPAPEPSAADRALLDAPLGRALWAWLGARYPERTLHLDLSPQLDLGIDSLEWVAISLELGERLGLRFADDDAARIQTLRDLLVIAAGRQAPAGAEGPAPVPERQLAWLAPRTRGERLLGAALYAANRAVLRGLFRLRVIGHAHLPARGPYVIACNHVSDLDPFIVAAALSHRELATIRWGGDAGRLFSGGAGRALSRAARIFPVDERAPAATLAIAAEVLARGEALVWFPESWRSPDGELQRFLPGIGRLVAGTEVPVVPARIAGAFEALPRGARLPRLARLQVAFGAPRTPAELIRNGDGESDAVRLAAGLRAEVARLPARVGAAEPPTASRSA